MLVAPGFFALLASIASRVAKAVANRRAAQELAEWDARALKDIGLTQADVQGALALPFHEDPTVLLASLTGHQGGASQDAGWFSLSHGRGLAQDFPLQVNNACA